MIGFVGIRRVQGPVGDSASYENPSMILFLEVPV